MGKNSPLAERLDDIRDRIAKACAKVKRAESEVTLIAVTKTAAPEQIREILQLGVTDLGESRVQALAQRAAQINESFARKLIHGDDKTIPRLRWHMIGHLQRNKIKQVLGTVSLIHSVDSLRLAEELDVAGAKAGKRIPVLLQINASEEVTKYGVAVGASVHLAEQIDSMPNVQITGLMSMGPLNGTEAQVAACFARTQEIFEEMKWHKIGGNNFRHLSMGMSGDFELAIEHGATLVRIGTGLFGGAKPDTDDSED